MVTLEFPLTAPTHIITLGDPVLLDSDSASRAFIKRETIYNQGQVHTFVNYPTNRNITVFNAAWDNIRKAKALELGEFFWALDENYIRYTDYNNVAWILNILDSEIPIASRTGHYECELYEFELTALRWLDA